MLLGMLDDVDAAFAMHVWPGAPVGQVATRTATIMAASSTFRVVVHGRGGHAAIPHLSVDPILAASHIITALQALVSRETSPQDAAVVSVTEFLAGSSTNVIPDDARLRGTIRTMTDEAHVLLKTRVIQVGFFACLFSAIGWLASWLAAAV